VSSWFRRELDGYVKALLGVARWYVGGERRSGWGDGKARLVGQCLRLARLMTRVRFLSELRD
jgi:hypothetical protein